LTEAEFRVFLEAAVEELRHKNNLLQEQHQIGSFARWWHEQGTAKLQFLDEAGLVRLEADTIHVGTYSPKSDTWRWAWGNDSVLPHLRMRALALRKLQAITGYDLFGNEHAFKIEEESMAWELAAISVKHLDALGCYRGPSSTGGPTTFLAIITIAAPYGGAS